MTTTIVTRSGKGSPLTNTELDSNFNNLKTTADAALPAVGGTISGSLIITSDLEVQGTTTSIDSTTVEITDLNITLAKDATSNTQANGAGITIAGSSAELKYVSSGDKWTLNKNLDVSGTIQDSNGTFLPSSSVSTFGGTLIDDADAAAARTTLGLGTAATSATGDFFASTSVSTFGASLIDDADAATARSTLGLGTMATSSSSDFLPLSGGSLTGGLSGTTGAFTGKLAVKSSAVHGSFDLYNNGTSYFNGSVTVDDALSITGGSASLSVAGAITSTGLTSSGDSVFQGNVTHNNNNASSKYFKLNVASSGDGHLLFQRNNTNYWQIHSDGSNVLKFDGYNGASSSVFSGSLTSTGLEVNGTRNFDGDYNITYYRKANHTTLGYQLFRDNGKSYYEWNNGGAHTHDLQFLSNNSPVLSLSTNGNVNIGSSLMIGSTSAPSNKLHVYDGNIELQSPSGSGGRYFSLNATDTGGRDYRLISTNNSHGSLGGGKFALLDNDVSGNDAAKTRMSIDSSGNALFSGSVTVGNTTIASNSSHFPSLTINNNSYIGSANATTAIQIGTSGGVTFASSIDSGNITSTGTINMNTDSAALYLGADIDMRLTHDGSNGTLRSDTGDLRIDTASYDDLLFRFGPSFTERARLTGTGRLGLGTTAPARGLQIHKEGNHLSLTTNSSGTAAGNGSDFKVDATTSDLQILNYESANITFWTSGSERVRIFSGGNTSIGSSTDLGYKLNVVGNALFRTDSATTSFGNHSSSIRIQNKNTTDNNYAGIVFDGSANAAGAIQFQYTDQSGSYGDICFETRGSGGYAERLRINADGSSVFSGTISSGAITVNHTDGTNNISLTPTSTGGVINARNSSGTSVVVMDGRGTPFIDVAGNLKTGGTTRIDSSGNLSSIGTISSGAISTSSSVAVTGAASAGISEGLLIDWSTNLARFLTYDSSTGSEIAFYTQPNGGSTTQALRIDSSQNASFSGSVTANGLTVNSGGANVATFDSSGRLLLGVTSATGYAADQDNFIIKGSAEAGMHIIGGTSSTTAINFGDGTGTAAYRGQITYHNADDTMRFNASGSEVARFTSNNLALGTTSTSSDAIVRFLHVANSTSAGVVLDAARKFSIFSSSSSTLTFRDETASANRLILDNSGRLGVNTTPNTPIHVASGSNGSGLIDVARFQNTGINANDGARIQLTAGTSTSGAGIGCLGDNLNSAHLVFHSGGNTERSRLTSGGNLLHGKNADNDSDVGIRMQSTGHTSIVKSGGNCLTLNRLSSDGSLLDFRRDTGTLVGSIGVINNDNLKIGGSVADHAGLQFALHEIVPMEAGVDSNGTINLGSANAKFQDAHFSGTVFAATGLGVGTTSTNAKVEISGKDDAGASDLLRLQFDNSPPDTGITFTDIFGTVQHRITMDSGNTNDFQLSSRSQMTFHTDSVGNTNERVRLSNSGTLLIGKTAEGSSDGIHFKGDGRGVFSYDGSGQNVLVLDRQSDGNMIQFNQANSTDGTVGTISVSNNATIYATSSDARLKDNIEDAKDSGDIIDKIKVRQFDWRKTGKHQDYGMIAQELILEVPDAVSTPTEDHEMMGIDYSKLVPLMMKEIQNLRKEIKSLKEKE